MSSFVFMKLLETQASRYDAGMRLLSLGRIGRLHRDVAAHVPAESRTLEIGCGTGSLTALLARNRCQVVGIDRSASMLAIARPKLAPYLDSGQVTLRHLTVTELDHAFADDEQFDCIVACLVFSELSHLEQVFVVEQLGHLLRRDGVVVIADEVVPRSTLGQVVYYALRFPLLAIAYLATQTTTRPIKGLATRLEATDFTTETTSARGGSYEVLVGRRLTVGSHA